MEMPTIYYTQNCVIGIAILALVYLNFRTICDRRQFSHGMFLWMLLAVALNLSLEYAFYMLVGRSGTAVEAILPLLTPVVFAMEPVPVALWVIYLVSVTHKGTRPSRMQELLILIPVMVNLALTLVNLRAGILYTINQQNQVQRGPAYILSPLVCYSYLFYYCYYAYRNREFMLHRDYKSIFFAMLPLAIAGIAQLLRLSVYVTWLSASFSMLILYSGIIVNQANTDYLTGLANRRRFDGQLEAAFSPEGRKAPSALLLIDIDNFKSINDGHGHLMGDRALEVVGTALRRSARKGDLVARIGGDEFAILAEVREPQDLQRIASRVRENLNALNQRRLFPFTIEISVGCGSCDEMEDLTPDAFIQMIDNRMYDEKRENHRRAQWDSARENVRLLKI